MNKIIINILVMGMLSPLLAYATESSPLFFDSTIAISKNRELIYLNNLDIINYQSTPFLSIIFRIKTTHNNGKTLCIASFPLIETTVEYRSQDAIYWITPIGTVIKFLANENSIDYYSSDYLWALKKSGHNVTITSADGKWAFYYESCSLRYAKHQDSFILQHMSTEKEERFIITSGPNAANIIFDYNTEGNIGYISVHKPEKNAECFKIVYNNLLQVSEIIGNSISFRYTYNGNLLTKIEEARKCVKIRWTATAPNNDYHPADFAVNTRQLNEN